MHKSFVFTSSTVGTSRRASFSHLQLLAFQGGLAQKLRFHIFNCWHFKEVSHKSFVFTSSTVGTSRRASFSHLQLLAFQGGLAQKLRFHIFNCWHFKEVSHKSFVFTSSPVGISRRSRTKASFSHLQLLAFQGGLAQKLRFHIFTCWHFKEVSHKSFVFTSSTVGISRRSRTKASFSHLQLLAFQGGLAQKLRFHIFNCWHFKEVSHKSFVFTSSTVGISRRSRTKASFSHLQLLAFQGGLAQKLRFHIFNCWHFKEVSHKSFVFTSSTVGISRRSRTKASFSHLQLLAFHGSLAQKLFFFCGSQCNGCVKVAWRRGCVGDRAVFRRWTW